MSLLRCLTKEMFLPTLIEQHYQSDPFNFLGLLDWVGDGGASINLPVVW